MCSKDKYSYLSEFAWYLQVLVKLAHLRGTKHGSLLAEQLIDVSMRVKPVRCFAARDMVRLLLDDSLMVGQTLEKIADAGRGVRSRAFGEGGPSAGAPAHARPPFPRSILRTLSPTG